MTSEFFPVDPKLAALADTAEDLCAEAFARIAAVQEYNEQKVLKAFMDNRVSEIHFNGSTGYGYGDLGRDTLDAVYAQAFGAEDALVRHNFVSGTHALSVALFGVLRAGDTMVSVTGKPYDTLEEVIGIRGEGNGSLKDFGVHYKEVALTPQGEIDLAAVPEAVQGAKVVYLQRSRGYSLRPSFSVDVISELVKTVRRVNPQAIIMVDNCYGEFAETREPTEVGADLIIGSLIKNPGGGIAQTGGYIAGRKDLVEQCSYRLTCVGMGKEVGCTLDQSRGMFMGFFFAPGVVANALRTSAFASCLFELLGFTAYPRYNEPRTDIIAALKLGSAERLVAFCQGIQSGSPVDSFVSPEPWDMPGYDSKVIMAAGAFTGGASIELSADAPLKEPYAVWLQGGLTYPTGKVGILLAAQSMADKGLLQL